MVDAAEVARDQRYSRALLAFLRRVGEAGATSNALLNAIDEAEAGEIDDERALVLLGSMVYLRRVAEHQGRFYTLGCSTKLQEIVASELDAIERSLAEARALRVGSEERFNALHAIKPRSPRIVLRMLQGNASTAAKALRVRGQRLEADWSKLHFRAYSNWREEQWLLEHPEQRAAA